MDHMLNNLYKSNMPTNATGSIHNYNLFGEVGDLPDVVHCETIEARSRLHDWEFLPHRHARLHQILLLQKGAGEATLEGHRNAIPTHSFVNVPMGTVHGFLFQPDTQGLVLTMAGEMLDETLRPSEGLGQILQRAEVRIAPQNVIQSMQAIAQDFASRDFARAQILRSRCALLLAQIAQCLADARPTSDTAAKPPILARFEALIETQYLTHWTVADYAQALSISPTHLSRVTRAAIGRSALRLIEERIIREARRNLVYTNLPVSSIAYALGYEDPAYFSRVFSRATGLSPRDFRTRATAAVGVDAAQPNNTRPAG